MLGIGDKDGMKLAHPDESCGLRGDGGADDASSDGVNMLSRDDVLVGPLSDLGPDDDSAGVHTSGRETEESLLALL